MTPKQSNGFFTCPAIVVGVEHAVISPAPIAPTVQSSIAQIMSSVKGRINPFARFLVYFGNGRLRVIELIGVSRIEYWLELNSILNNIQDINLARRRVYVGIEYVWWRVKGPRKLR